MLFSVTCSMAGGGEELVARVLLRDWARVRVLFLRSFGLRSGGRVIVLFERRHRKAVCLEVRLRWHLHAIELLMLMLLL